jgi:putative cell wall-binding protein
MDDETENKNIEHDDEISKLVEDMEIINTIFNEPEDMLKGMTESFENKSYANILESSKDILTLLEEPTRKFVRIGMAFSISSATKWVSPMGDAGVDISEVEELISKAKKHFNEGDFSSVNETIDQVRKMIPELEEQQKDMADDYISSTEKLIQEVEESGANVDSAKRSLAQAKSALEIKRYQDVINHTRDAKEAAEIARDSRVQTVSDALLFTRSVIEESKGVGVDISEPDKLYKEAKAAFARGEYDKCSKLTKEAEEKALKLQDEHIQRVMELKQKREAMDKERTKPEPPKREESSDEEEKCPTCAAPLRYVAKYDRHWCRECKKYAPRKKA